MNNFKKTIFKGFLWDFLGKFVRRGLTFVLSVFITRQLFPEDYGLMAMIGVLIAFSSVFLNAGLGAALIQKKGATEAHFSSAFYATISMGILLTALFYFNAEHVAQFYEEPKLVNITKVLSFNLLITSFGVVHNVKLTKAMNFSVRTKADLFASVIAGIVALILAFNEFGVWSLVYQLMIYNILSILSLWYLAAWRPRWVFQWEALKSLWEVGNPIFLSGILNKLFENIDAVVIGKFFGTGELGLFNRAKSLRLFTVQFASESIRTVLFPLLASFQDNDNEFKRIVLNTLSMVGFITFGLVGLLFLIAEPLIITLYTTKWIGAVFIFKLFILSAYAYPIHSIIAEAIKGKGKFKLHLQTLIATKIIYAIGILYGIYYGFEAFLYALIIVSALNSVIYLKVGGDLLSVRFISLLKELGLYLTLACVWVIGIKFSLSNIQMENLTSIFILSIAFGALYLFSNYLIKSKGLRLIYENIASMVIRRRL